MLEFLSHQISHLALPALCLHRSRPLGFLNRHRRRCCRRHVPPRSRSHPRHFCASG